MYKLALRHACVKPVIHITENIQDLPFDINDHRTICYTDDMKGALELKDHIYKMMDEIENSKEPISNPIVDSLKVTSIVNPRNEEIQYTNALEVILSEINMINEKVDRLAREKTFNDFF